MNGGQATVLALRQEFDRGFRDPVAADPVLRHDFICADAGGGAYAFAAGDVRQILKCPPLTRLPSKVPALAGVGAVRGALVGFYDLGLLLGAAPAVNGQWAVLCASDASVGVIFNAFGGYARVAPAAIHAAADVAMRDLTPRVVTVGDRDRLIVDLPALLSKVINRATLPAST